MKQVICGILLIMGYALGQTVEKSSFQIILFPTDSTIRPILANNSEPKMGILYYPDNGVMKIDIGKTSDLVMFSFNSNYQLSLALEFMGYANAFESQGYWRVSAMDAYFGARFFLSNSNHPTNQWRLRFVHHSAHLVDGIFDYYKVRWDPNILPIGYSQDFIELIHFADFSLPFGGLRIYGGGNYSLTMRPPLINRWEGNLGAEFHTPPRSESFIGYPYSYVLSYHFKLAGYPAYQGVNEIIAGVKFGKWESKGAIVYLSYHSGSKIYGQFFQRKDTKFGLGILVDMP